MGSVMTYEAHTEAADELVSEDAYTPIESGIVSVRGATEAAVVRICAELDAFTDAEDADEVACDVASFNLVAGVLVEQTGGAFSHPDTADGQIQAAKDVLNALAEKECFVTVETANGTSVGFGVNASVTVVRVENEDYDLIVDTDAGTTEYVTGY